MRSTAVRLPQVEGFCKGTIVHACNASAFCIIHKWLQNSTKGAEGRGNGQQPTSELAQPDLQASGDDGVCKVVEGQAGGHIEGEPASREGQEGDEKLRGPVALVLGVHRWGDEGRGHPLGHHQQHWQDQVPAGKVPANGGRPVL